VTPELLVWHIDDDPFELERVRKALEQNAMDCRYIVESFDSPQKLYERFRSRPFADVILMDIHMGEENPTGIEVAKECRGKAPEAVILMCSSADDVTTIAESLRTGADDFISKRSDKGELSLRITNSYHLAKLKQGGPDRMDPEASASRRVLPKKFAGATAERIASRVPLLINSAVTAVFVRGESGTGKEVVADLFQQALPPSAPFIRVNCGAIAPTLLESELFGHVKGAFTGAVTDKKGLMEAANGGWIFLDEVATLSLPAQVALLRVLENQEVTRVGSTKSSPINVRVISATNEPIEDLIKQNRFRKDLWQRLCEAEVFLPALRDRPDEIPAMIDQFCKTMSGGPYQASGPVIEVFQRYPWKDGNVRELRNCLRAMTELHVNGLLTPLAIPERIWEQLGDQDADQGAVPTHESPNPDPPIGRPAPNREASAGAGRSPGKGSNSELLVSFDPTRPQNFDDLADSLLLAVTKKMAESGGRLSLRGLAKAIGMSRSTLSGRLKAIVQKGMISMNELASVVGVTEKVHSEAGED